MTQAATIPWSATDLAIDRFCEFYKTRRVERHRFGQLALATGHLQMAAIAAAAEHRLEPGAEADAIAGVVIESVLTSANIEAANGDFAREADCIQAGFLAARGRRSFQSPLTERLTDRVNERIVEELDRDPPDLAVIAAFTETGAVTVETLHGVFDKAVMLKAHRMAGLAADAIVAGGGGRLDRPLLTSLRALTRDMLQERDAEAAASYFPALNRMAGDIASVAILVPRVVRLLADDLQDKLRDRADGAVLVRACDDLARVDPGSPALLRCRALLAARRGDEAGSRGTLDALEAASAPTWRLVLLDARAALEGGDERCALILFGWLGDRGHAAPEAAKVKRSVLRSRIVALKASRSLDNTAIARAADAVLELEPDNAWALWTQARASVRLRRVDESLGLLRQLLTVSPGYPGAADLVVRLESRRAS